MPITLGKNAKAYVVTGTAPSLTYTEADSVTNVNLDLNRDTADVTRRSSGGYRQEVGTLAAGTVTFDLIQDTDDTFFNTIRAAYIADTTVRMWFGNGAVSTAAGDAYGFQAEFGVTDMSEAQELEDAIRHSVSLSVRGSTPTPGFYETDGSGDLTLIT